MQLEALSKAWGKPRKLGFGLTIELNTEGDVVASVKGSSFAVPLSYEAGLRLLREQGENICPLVGRLPEQGKPWAFRKLCMDASSGTPDVLRGLDGYETVSARFSYIFGCSHCDIEETAQYTGEQPEWPQALIHPSRPAWITKNLGFEAAKGEFCYSSSEGLLTLLVSKARSVDPGYALKYLPDSRVIYDGTVGGRQFLVLVN